MGTFLISCCQFRAFQLLGTQNITGWKCDLNEQLYKNKFHFMPKVGYTRISPSKATVKLSNRFAMNSLNITEYSSSLPIRLKNDVKYFFKKF